MRVDCSAELGLRVWNQGSTLLRVWQKIHLSASGLANLPPPSPDEFSREVSCAPTYTMLMIVYIPPRCAFNGLGDR